MTNWKRIVKKVAHIGGEMAQVVAGVGTNPSPLGLAAILAKAGGTVLDVSSASPTDFFRGWRPLTLPDVGECLVKNMLADGVLVEEYTKEGSGVALLGEVAGTRIGFVSYANGGIDGPYVEADVNSSAAYRALADYAWVKFNGSIVYTATVYMYGSGNGQKSMQEDKVGKSLPSSLANSAWGQILKFVDAGHPTAALLYGPPGTGKSCAAKRLAELAGGRCLRLNGANFSENDTRAAGIVEFLRPDCVIVDDLDSDGCGISGFDQIKAQCRLLVATANVKSKIKPALLRAERFDYIIFVANLGREVVEGLLEGVPSDIIDEIADLPVAYIEKFRKNFKFFGEEEARKLVPQLKQQALEVQQALEAAETTAEDQK